MSSLCLIAGLLVAPLGDSLTLVWTHSIQKTRWEEDYRLKQDNLLLESARIEGTGAGMEPPDDAIFQSGKWHYTPRLPPLSSISLMHSSYAAPYIVCNQQHCRSLPEWLPDLPENSPVELRLCPPGRESSALNLLTGGLYITGKPH